MPVLANSHKFVTHIKVLLYSIMYCMAFTENALFKSSGHICYLLSFLANSPCGKFGRELNLVVWRSTFVTAKLNLPIFHTCLYTCVDPLPNC